jgi:hypothetical protein
MSSGAQIASRTWFHAHKTPRRDRLTYPLKAVMRISNPVGYHDKHAAPRDLASLQGRYPAGLDFC